jgi:hypothetical protein
MAISKVFLFNTEYWLYCTDVAFVDDTWQGWVVNGAWYMEYDTKLGGLFVYKNKSDAASFFAVSTFKAELSWVGNIGDFDGQKRIDYNDVLEDAKVRYVNGEPADYDVTPEPVDEEYELYLRLRDKYDDIPF